MQIPLLFHLDLLSAYPLLNMILHPEYCYGKYLSLQQRL